MRAAALKSGQIDVTTTCPSPTPGFGQVLVQVKACGICGSDLHFAKHGADDARPRQADGGHADHGVGTADARPRARTCSWATSSRPRCSRSGPDTVAPAAGHDRHVDPDPAVDDRGVRADRLQQRRSPAATASACSCRPRCSLEVPERARLPPRRADRADGRRPPRGEQEPSIAPGEGALVLGCGPVGLAVIARAEAEGHRAPSSPPTSRRPAGRSPPRWAPPRWSTPRSSRPSTRGAGSAAASRSSCFEAIGVPGIIDGVLTDAPHGTRLVVVGVCMETRLDHPFFGISKELNIQFCLGYDPMEFADTLRADRRGRDRRRPDDHRRGRPRRGRRRLRGARQPRRPLQDPGDPVSDRFAGKVALVTGAARPRGIGRATALRLAARRRRRRLPRHRPPLRRRRRRTRPPPPTTSTAWSPRSRRWAGEPWRCGPTSSDEARGRGGGRGRHRRAGHDRARGQRGRRQRHGLRHRPPAVGAAPTSSARCST